MAANIRLVIICAAACLFGLTVALASESSVRITDIVPPPSQPLRAGEKVHLRVTVEYTLNSASGTVSLLVSKAEVPVSGVRPPVYATQEITKGNGTVILEADFTVPETRGLTVLTPLSGHGSIETGTADFRWYEVAQSLSLIEGTNIVAVAAYIAKRTGRTIAVAPDLTAAEVPFSYDEAVAPEELYREFVRQLHEIGLRALDVGNVTTIVPDKIAIATPGEHKVTIDFDGMNLAAVAAHVGKITGKIIAVPSGTRVPSVSFSVTEPITPDELYSRFVAMVEHLGYRVVEAERVVAIVPNEAP